MQNDVPTWDETDPTWESTVGADDQPASRLSGSSKGIFADVLGATAQLTGPGGPGLPNPLAGVTADPSSPEFNNQVGENLSGFAKGAGMVLPIAASVAAPMAAVSAVPGLAPSTASGILGYLGRSAALNAIGAGAGQTTTEAINAAAGDETEGAAGRVGKSMAIGAAFAPLNPLVEKLLLAGGGAVMGGIQGIQQALATQALSPLLKRTGEAIKGGIRGAKQQFGLGLVRPLYGVPDPELERIEAARALIESTTGQKVPQSLGEALGKTTFGKPYVEVERALGAKASGSITDEARNQASRTVLHTASQLLGTGATKQEIAEAALRALQTESKAVSDPVKAEVTSLVDDLYNALDSELSKIGGRALLITRPDVELTKTESGDYSKLLAKSGIDLWRDRQRELFDAYRAELGTGAMAAGLPKAKKAAEQLKLSGLFTTDKQGARVPLASTFPDAAAETEVNKIIQAADTPQDIEALRRHISDFSDQIRFGVLSKLPDANKKMLREALKEDLIDAIEALPNTSTKPALLAANKFTSDTIDEMLNPSIVKAATSASKGGTAGGSVFDKLGRNPTDYKRFVNILGPQADQFREVMRSGILTDARLPGRGVVDLEGNVNVGKLLGLLQKLPREIADDLGISTTIKELEKLAARQPNVQSLLSAGEKARAGDIGKSLDWLTINQNEVDSLLGKSGVARLQSSLLSRAVEQVAYRNRILSEVADGMSSGIEENPTKFLNYILTGKPDSIGVKTAAKALDIVRRNSPDTARQIQVEYLKDLLDKSTIDGVISGKTLSQLVSKPVAGAAPSSGGKALDLSTEILGTAKLDNVRQMADALATIQKPYLEGSMATRTTAMELLTAADTPVDATWAALAKAGFGRSMALASHLTKKPAAWRYLAVAKMVDDPKLWPLLTKPMDKLSQTEASQLWGTVSALVSEDQQP